jgi:23S rRNA pseudouridine1911/1915/1917 synthase
LIITVDAPGAGKRIDSFLHERLPEFSRARLQSWIKNGRVTLGGQPVRPSYLVRTGDELSVQPTELPPLRAEPEELPLKILYEDPDMIVVDKPAGMVVHAGAGHSRGTLVNALLHHFGSLSSLNGDLRPGIVHRLDRDTSGVLAVARTDRGHRFLARQFHDREVEKVYLALVHGRMKQRDGRIDSPISRDPVRRTRMTTKLAHGRVALTQYRVLEEFECFSYLEVRIGTGRTHQIRAHLASLHHPVFGDRVYGAPARPPGMPSLDRFFLHACQLRLKSPSSGEYLVVESALPAELQAVLEHLRRKLA